jgi:hypothetical protein
MLYLAAKDGEIIEQTSGLPSEAETEVLAGIALTALWVDLLEFGFSTSEVAELIGSVSAEIERRMAAVMEDGGAA